MASTKVFFRYPKIALSARLSLRANFYWACAGNVVYAICQWGMMAALTKLGSPEMVGQFALGLAVTAPIIIFTNLQLRSIQATDAKKEFTFGDYLSLRLLTTLVALIAIFTLAILSNYRWETTLIILSLAVVKSIEAISDIVYGLLQHHERMDRIAISMFMKGPLSLLALASGVYFTGNIFWGVAGMGVVWLLILLVYDYPGSISLASKSASNLSSILAPGQPSAYMALRLDKSVLTKLTKIALPLGIASMLISVNSNIPRYFIGYYWGEHELGIFSAIVYLMIIGATVINALGQAASPRLSQLYAANQPQAFKNLLLKLMLVALLVGTLGVVAAMTVGSAFLTFIYQAEYAKQDVLILLMVAAGIGYLNSFLGYSLVSLRYFRVQLLIFSVVALVITLVSWQLIPTYKLHGAALALISGAIVQGVGCYFFVHNRLRSR